MFRTRPKAGSKFTGGCIDQGIHDLDRVPKLSKVRQPIRDLQPLLVHILRQRQDKVPHQALRTTYPFGQRFFLIMGMSTSVVSLPLKGSNRDRTPSRGCTGSLIFVQSPPS
ncbi:unnamed protein product [Linum trigynum]|uniref:Uncharacterized protein n=1 Tax=Linum trigynum TaxID=586398 RepID=A0AAV2ENE8_9ROSI